MSEDSFTEVTSEGWMGRIGGAIKGIFVGIGLFIVAFPLLWWNEGRAVNTEKKINFANDNVVAVEAAAVNKANEGKLVHMSGKATTDEKLTDSVFGVSANAIKLIRSVEMYQWDEEVETKTKKKLGGGKEKKKTYSYSKKWSSSLIDSGNFKKQTFTNVQGQMVSHQNPGVMKYSKNEVKAKKVTLGSFTLSESLKSSISRSTPLSVTKAPAGLTGSVKVMDGYYYIGKDAVNPQIGDMKIRFKTVDPQDVSIMAKQVGSTFGSYQTPYGSYEQLESGNVGVAGMIASAKASNSFMTWGLRIGGLVLMMIGLGMVFKPLSVIADVVPFIGDFVEMGTGILSFLIAVPCALLTIGMAWIFYRPMIGVPLVAVAVGFIVMVIMKKKKAVEV